MSDLDEPSTAQRSKPVVGVTGPERGGYPAWLFTSWAVRAAGGIPCRLTPSREVPERLDGLIVGGGADVAPERYGAAPIVTPREATAEISRVVTVVGRLLSPCIGLARRLGGRSARTVQAEGPSRDALELALLEAADRVDVPTLGICRGAQLLNVHAGGSLHQSLVGFYSEVPNPWSVLPAKCVSLAPSSRLALVLGSLRCTVNSLHRQAIDRVGSGLRVVAHDDQGVVQAVESTLRSFWLGVQWHPEYMPQIATQRRLIQGLVGAARQRTSRGYPSLTGSMVSRS